MEKLKVLIVDDEPYIRESICLLINSKENDYEVTAECYNAHNAIDIIKKEHIDIVITDIRMPKMSGIDLIRETKIINSSIQFIVLSAYNDFELVRQAFQYGIDDYIVKTELNYERLLKSLDSAKYKILELKKSPGSQMKETLLKSLIVRGCNQGEILSKLANFEFKPSLKSLRMVVIQINDFQRSINDEFNCDEVLIIYGIKNIIEEILMSSNFKSEYFYHDNGKLILFVDFASYMSEQDKLKELEKLYRDISVSIKRFINRDIYMGVSAYIQKSAFISDLYLQAETACKMNFVLEKDFLVYYDVRFVSNNSINLENHYTQVRDILKKFADGD